MKKKLEHIGKGIHYLFEGFGEFFMIIFEGIAWILKNSFKIILCMIFTIIGVFLFYLIDNHKNFNNFLNEISVQNYLFGIFVVLFLILLAIIFKNFNSKEKK